MKRGEKLDIDKLTKPDFMTEAEWQVTRETIAMLNRTLPDDVWAAVGDKVTSLGRIKADAVGDREKLLETAGQESTQLGDTSTVLLTTTGRKSGKQFTTPVNVVREGNGYYIVASLGGYDIYPQWYLNLEKNPRVWVQEKDKKTPATARRLSREEKARLWPRLLKDGQALWAYFQMFTTREFPVILITPDQ
ncbi:MAG: nitroreductase/quinone reductase family protein [Candidatus Binatia bacterium]